MPNNIKTPQAAINFDKNSYDTTIQTFLPQSIVGPTNNVLSRNSNPRVDDQTATLLYGLKFDTPDPARNVYLNKNGDIATGWISFNRAINLKALSGTESNTNEGDLYYDGTQKVNVSSIGIPERLIGCICTGKANNVVPAGTLAYQRLDPPSRLGTSILPAGLFRVGKSLRFYLAGITSTTAGNSITIRVQLNNTVLMERNITLSGSANFPLVISGVITCQAIGTSGSFVQSGKIDGVEIGTGGGVINGGALFLSTVSTTVNTTIAQDFNIYGAWSAVNGSSLTTTNYLLEVIN